MSTLKDYWPFPSFRAGQEEVLEEIEESWDQYDVFVVRAPTAWGKSPLAVALQNWVMGEHHASAAITVPNNVLREQYLDEFAHLKTIRALKDYWIEEYGMSELEFRKKIYQYGPRNSQYNLDRSTVKRVGSPICVNYHSYIAHKLQRNTVIVDEAHLLLGTLQEFAARKIWRHKTHYPFGLRSLADVQQWAEQAPPSPAIQRLRDEMESLTPATLIQLAKEPYRGVMKECIKLLPLSVENDAPIFWPSKTNKVVLISATLGEDDLRLMGHGTKRIKWISPTSPIPVDRRAIKLDFIGNMSYHNQDRLIEDLLDKISSLRERYLGSKGFVHASYSLANKIRHAVRGDPSFDWMVFHGRDNKQDVYDDFAASSIDTSQVMIGSGMAEGIDMHEDIARWQCIAKIPYPSLADPAMRYIAQNNSDYYNWMVSREIMQSAGRVCRSPDDYGITHILDNSWVRWYENVADRLPEWFTEAVETT